MALFFDFCPDVRLCRGMNDSGAEPLANLSHEAFALLLAQGEVSAAEAYRQEVSATCAVATSETKGPALARKSQVRVRIEWLKGQVNEKAKEKAEGTILTMLEKREFLARVVRTPVGEVTEMSDLCQEKDETFGDNPKLKIKMPDKLRAIALDNDLAGEGSEAKGQDAMVALLGRLRQ